MKKSYRFCTIFLPVFALAACTNDDLQDNPLANGPVPLNVTADISAVATRVQDNNGSASFTTGDIMHVVAGNQDQYDYSLQADNTWDAGDNPYYFQNTTPVDFRAWYAPDGAIELSADNAIPIDTKQQTITNNWNKWDILATPNVTAGVSSPSINFTGDKAFRHVMCQVAFTFIAGTDAGIPDIKGLSVYTLKDVITDATFDQRSCTLTRGSTTGDITGRAQNPGSTIPVTMYTTTPFIVVPQEPASSRSLEVKYNYNTYKANLTIPTGGWKPNHSYIYTIIIRNTGLEISNASIAGWIIVNNYNDNAYLQ